MSGSKAIAKIDSETRFGALKLVHSNPAPEASFALSSDLIAQTNAAQIWAHSSTNLDLDRAKDIIRDKLRVVSGFILYLDKDLVETTPLDVMAWQEWMQASRNLKARTIYNYSSHLSSFFEYLRSINVFAEYIRFNPVRAAFPRSPKAFQTRAARSLSDKSLKALWRTMEKVRSEKTVIGLRDYALFRFFVATGDRRAEILNLRGADVELFRSGLIYYPRTKGGGSVGKTIADKDVKKALLDYIYASGRRERDVFGLDTPLWLAHDGAARSRSSAVMIRGAFLSQNGLTSRAFAGRMKIYAERAKIYNFHLHQFRHTFARIVAEETQSLAHVQEALGHKNLKTTKNYVPVLEIRGDSHSGRIKKRSRRRF